MTKECSQGLCLRPETEIICISCKLCRIEGLGWGMPSVLSLSYLLMTPPFLETILNFMRAKDNAP